MGALEASIQQAGIVSSTERREKQEGGEEEEKEEDDAIPLEIALVRRTLWAADIDESGMGATESLNWYCVQVSQVKKRL